MPPALFDRSTDRGRRLCVVGRLPIVRVADLERIPWALMGLLFVGGVMNLLWVAAITFAVLAEKLAPKGGWIARATGAALILAGVWVIAAGTGHGPAGHR